MQTLKLKSVGNDVVQLQRVLCQWGYTIEETCIFDATTETVVKQFQKNNSLVLDGIVGVKT